MQVKTTKIEDDKWEEDFSRTKGLVVITEGALDSIIYYMLNYMGKTEDNIKAGFWIGETEEEVDEEVEEESEEILEEDEEELEEDYDNEVFDTQMGDLKDWLEQQGIRVD